MVPHGAMLDYQPSLTFGPVDGNSSERLSEFSGPQSATGDFQTFRGLQNRSQG
jgi:hypothetical protein